MTDKQTLSVGELISELSDDLRTLVRQEVALAKAEIGTKVKALGKDAAMVAVGAVFGYLAMLAGLATVILVIALWLPAWVAALIVTVFLGIIGGAILLMGISSMRKRDLAPKQTLETLKEDAEWAKQQWRAATTR